MISLVVILVIALVMMNLVMNRKIKLFITKLMEDLESVQAELESREETLINKRISTLLARKLLH